MTTATATKCACPSCTCEVDTSKAIEKANKYYCSRECADGHPNGHGNCGKKDCGC
jgi:metallothionein